MSNAFHGRGNLGADPVLRNTEVNGERATVVNLRVYFDRRIPDGDGEFEDRGGFWMKVAYWGRNAETLARILRKGSRVHVEGDQFESSWTDADSGAERRRLEVRATHVDLDPGRIATVEWQPSEARGDAQHA